MREFLVCTRNAKLRNKTKNSRNFNCNRSVECGPGIQHTHTHTKSKQKNPKLENPSSGIRGWPGALGVHPAKKKKKKARTCSLFEERRRWRRAEHSNLSQSASLMDASGSILYWLQSVLWAFRTQPLSRAWLIGLWWPQCGAGSLLFPTKCAFVFYSTSFAYHSHLHMENLDINPINLVIFLLVCNAELGRKQPFDGGPFICYQGKFRRFIDERKG